MQLRISFSGFEDGRRVVDDFESAITKRTNPAAAQLDHFLLRKKVGTRTVLAENPGFVLFVKHGLIDSKASTTHRPQIVPESLFLESARR
jgi:hypothetical protein